MANLEWSPEKVQAFLEYCETNGAQAVKVDGPDMRGDYIFHLQTGPKSATLLMQDFLDQRRRDGKS